MTMAIDIGNTHISIGLFKGDELAQRWRLRTRNATPDEFGLQLFQLFQIHKIEFPRQTVICSVVPNVTPLIMDAIERYLPNRIILLKHDSDFGLTIRYETPTTLGVDRLVDAFAAAELYGRDCVVIDTGSATTIDAVTREREFLGGVIVAGLEMMAEALASRTAQLFKTDLVAPEQVIGRSTRACIQSGLIYGAVALVDGVVTRIVNEWDAQPHVIATGGNAALLAAYSQTIHEVQPLLTLQGLRKLADRLC